jgi:hypothetical protein
VQTSLNGLMPQPMNIFRNFTVLLLACFLSSAALAQTNLEEVIYLQNGSILRGVIVEEIPNKSYKIQLQGGSIFHVEFADVIKLTKEPIQGAAVTEGKTSMQTDKVPFVFTPRKRGYFFQSQLLIENLQGGLRIINGYRFGRFGTLGIGLGFDVLLGAPLGGLGNSYNYDQLSGVYLPIYLYYSGDILKKKITPFYAVELGYAFATPSVGGFTSVETDMIGGGTQIDRIRGGAMGGLGIGVKFNTKRRLHFSLLLNVNFKVASYQEYYYAYDSASGGYYNSGSSNVHSTLVIPGLRFGIGF